MSNHYTECVYSSSPAATGRFDADSGYNLEREGDPQAPERALHEAEEEL
jgi:hypothetical protein